MQFGRKVLANEKAVHLACNVFAGDRLRQDHIDDVDAVEAAMRAEECLGGRVVFFRSNHEIEVHEIPPGKGTRGFANVGFAVVTYAHREHFHDLAREIFVRCTLHVHAGIEERKHCRILRDADQQGAEVAGALRSEQLVLLEHLAVVAHLLFASCEMPVPEQRHFLLERTMRRQHAIGPPVGDAIGLQSAGPQPVEEFVGHRLQAAVAGRLDLDAHRFAGFLGEVGGGGARGGKGFQSRIMGAGIIERRKVVRDVLVVDQPAHGGFGRHRRELGDFLRRAAEAGAFEQVGGALRVPVRRGNRRKVAGPVLRSAAGERNR